MPRDSFSKPTIENLGKRVSYLCSNPRCRKVTIGAHHNPDRSVLIGIAAHITAASPGGPRFDSKLTPEERSSHDNGIWLCSDCANLIDKDVDKYSVELIRSWKSGAETESAARLAKNMFTQKKGAPHLEVDLIWSWGRRSPRNYSAKNPIETHDGKQVMIIKGLAIIHWALYWNFDLFIFNNSTYNAYNIKIESIGKFHFTQLDTLPSINNLPALQNIQLEARLVDFLESDHVEADKIVRAKIPPSLNNVGLLLTYYDDDRVQHATEVTFKDGMIINNKRG